MTVDRTYHLRSLIDEFDREIGQLEARYGDGIRPAWVGEEIGYIAARRQECRAELVALEASGAADA